MRPYLTLMLVLVTVPLEAAAGWTVSWIRPDVEELDGGIVRVTAVRILPENNAAIHRTCRLTVADENGPLLTTSMVGSTSTPDRATYQFEIRKTLLRHTKLELFEKERSKLKILGGGNIYQYSTTY